jgi:phage tail-like protein
MSTLTNASRYIKYLPEIFHADSSGNPGGFLGEYLKIIEAFLHGRSDALLGSEKIASLNDWIAKTPAYLDPATTPVNHGTPGEVQQSDFLNYLAGWVGLTLDNNWSLEKRRQWLQRIVPLYKTRGTRKCLEEYLKMFVGNNAWVQEPSGGFVIGDPENSTVGESTYIAGAPAYFFKVNINYGFAPAPFSIEEWKNVGRSTRAIVDREKPAHTYYHLRRRAPGIIVGGPVHPPGVARATIGIDTLIWKDSKKI